MADGKIIRGTNPTHEFEIPYDLDDIKKIRVIYGQKNQSIVKRFWNKGQVNENCEVNEGKVIVHLTQNETYKFSPSKLLEIEIRIQLTDGQVIGSEEPIKLVVIDTMDEGSWDEGGETNV